MVKQRFRNATSESSRSKKETVNSAADVGDIAEMPNSMKYPLPECKGTILMTARHISGIAKAKIMYMNMDLYLFKTLLRFLK